MQTKVTRLGVNFGEMFKVSEVQEHSRDLGMIIVLDSLHFGWLFKFWKSNIRFVWSLRQTSETADVLNVRTCWFYFWRRRCKHFYVWWYFDRLTGQSDLTTRGRSEFCTLYFVLMEGPSENCAFKCLQHDFRKKRMNGRWNWQPIYFLPAWCCLIVGEPGRAFN